MDKGYTLVEFIVSLSILGIVILSGFIFFNFETDMISETIAELEMQANIRSAARFINNLLVGCDPSDIDIFKDRRGSNKLIVKKTTCIYLSKETLRVEYEYPSGTENTLADYITKFQVTDSDGLISINITAENEHNENPMTIGMQVYLGD